MWEHVKHYHNLIPIPLEWAPTDRFDKIGTVKGWHGTTKNVCIHTFRIKKVWENHILLRPISLTFHLQIEIRQKFIYQITLV